MIRLHAGEGAAWGLPLKGKCKAVELAAYWPCLRAYLESRANETARVVVVSTAGRADLPGADGAPVPDVTYLADRPPPPCVPASCRFLCLRPSVAVPSPRSRCLRRAPEDAIDAGPDDSATTSHRRDQTRQRCARRRATPRSNAHVDAIARDLDVMASATAIFFSPASSMALLGAALAPEDVHLFEVCFAASFCPLRFVVLGTCAGAHGLGAYFGAASAGLRRERYPPDAIGAISRRRVPTQVRSHAKGCGGVGAACHRLKSHKRGGGVYTAASPSSLPS